jgi:hypothetical protein
LVTFVSSNAIVIVKTMAFAKIFRWPRRTSQHTFGKGEPPGGSPGQDLYQCCNGVIRDFERAFTLPKGWAVHEKELVFYLQEAALGLKQWKDSIRWCATPDHYYYSELGNEKLVQLVLTSLKEENLGLFETISQHMRDVAKALDSIEQLYIQGGGSANRSTDHTRAKYYNY